jgi:pimeloyl-ACP methyl ester carboxylesterase
MTDVTHLLNAIEHGDPHAANQLLPPSYGKAYQKYLPHAQWQVIPQWGHMAMFEKETEFVEAVTRFCAM